MCIYILRTTIFLIINDMASSFLLLLEKISDLKVYTFKYNVTKLMLNMSTDLFFYNLVGLPVNHLHVLTLVTKSMQLEHAE